jgi:hypothetical protein
MICDAGGNVPSIFATGIARSNSTSVRFYDRLNAFLCDDCIESIGMGEFLGEDLDDEDPELV